MLKNTTRRLRAWRRMRVPALRPCYETLSDWASQPIKDECASSQLLFLSRLCVLVVCVLLLSPPFL